MADQRKNKHAACPVCGSKWCGHVPPKWKRTDPYPGDLAADTAAQEAKRTPSHHTFALDPVSMRQAELWEKYGLRCYRDGTRLARVVRGRGLVEVYPPGAHVVYDIGKERGSWCPALRAEVVGYGRDQFGAHYELHVANEADTYHVAIDGSENFLAPIDTDAPLP